MTSQQIDIDAVRAAIIDPLLRRLYDYWLERRSLRPMPSRSDIDPVDMRFMLGNILLADVLAAPRRFHIRLHGTNLVHRAGYELTGKMLEQLPDEDFRARARECFTTVVETRRPAHSRRSRTLSGRPQPFEAVILPLSRTAPHVDMLLVGLRYANDPSSSSVASAATQAW
jgi:hypothetical protein